MEGTYHPRTLKAEAEELQQVHQGLHGLHGKFQASQGKHNKTSSQSNKHSKSLSGTYLCKGVEFGIIYPTEIKMLHFIEHKQKSVYSKEDKQSGYEGWILVLNCLVIFF